MKRFSGLVLCTGSDFLICRAGVTSGALLGPIEGDWNAQTLARSLRGMRARRYGILYGASIAAFALSSVVKKDAKETESIFDLVRGGVSKTIDIGQGSVLPFPCLQSTCESWHSRISKTAINTRHDVSRCKDRFLRYVPHPPTSRAGLTVSNLRHQRVTPPVLRSKLRHRRVQCQNAAQPT